MLAGLGCRSKPPVELRYLESQTKFREGNIDYAVTLADQGYRELEKRDAVWSWKFRILEADMLLWRGVPDQTLNLLGGIPPSNLPTDAAARVAILRGRALCKLGKADESQSALKDAGASISSSNRQLQAELAFARAKCSGGVAARSYYQQTADLSRGIDPFNEANALLYTGFFHLQDKDYEGAISDLRRALSASESLLLLREKALGNLGYAYSQVGEFRRAIYNSTQAEKFASNLAQLNPKEPWIKSDQMRWLIDLGREHFHQLEYSDAERSFTEALALSKEVRDQDGTAICLHNLAQLALRVGVLAKAEAYIGQLEELKPGGSRFLTLLLDQAELAKAQARFPSAEQFLKQILNGESVDPLLRRQAQSDLALVYVAQKNFDQAEKMFRSAITTAEETRSKIRNVEHRISFLDYSPFYDQYVKFLVSRDRPLEALDIAELGRSPTLSEALGAPKRNTLRGPLLKRIQQQLQAQHGVALVYWLGWEESYLWAITPTQVRLFHLPAEPEIEKVSEAYNREIVDRAELGASLIGDKLYDILVRSAAPLIPNRAKVIIIPHRKLYNLNFETIVVPGPTPHYWIEDVRLQSASFLGVLVNRSPAGSYARSKKLLLIGTPVLADERFPVLKYAPEEMAKVASHFPAAYKTVFASSEATSRAYLDSKPSQFQFLHFVTHGTSSTLAESPLDASIILSPYRDNSTASADPEGSYHLYGKEIMNTPLHADLVTVSACYGLGREYSGEGLVGLAWSFLRAGAHQVIAALWEVDDASSPQLMDDFYGELTQGKSAAEALRDAKLKMLHSSDFHRHPYYWASLQLYTGS